MKIVEIEFTPAGSRILTFTRNENNELVKQRYMQDHYFYVEDPDGDSTTLFGEKVKKRKVKKFWETKAVVKNTDKRTFEDDLSYTKRFLIDKGRRVESPGNPRVFFYDIETIS